MSDKIKIYNPFTKKDTVVEPLGRTAKRIYKYLIEEKNKDPDAVLPDNVSYINKRFVKVKTIVDTNNVRRITYSQIRPEIIKQLNSMGVLRKIFKSYKNQTIKVVVKYSTFDIDDMDEQTIKNVTEKQIEAIFEIPENFNEWWKTNSNFFWIDSETDVFDKDNNDMLKDPKLQTQMIILTLDKIGEEDYEQYFLDGITHCFFQPIVNWAENCKENSKSKVSQNRYKTILNKCNKYIDIYKTGIPEKDMIDVCNNLRISVEIDLPSTMLDKTNYIEVESQKKPLKKFKFVNTRLNHIELNEVSNKSEYCEVSKEELNEYFENAQKNNEFILWKRTTTGLLQINTLHNTYKLKDENGYFEISRDFEDSHNFINYKIEYNTNKVLSEFLRSALHMNLSKTFLPKFQDESFTYEDIGKLIDDKDYLDDYLEDYTPDRKILCDFVKSLETLNHIDIKKAYANTHKCSMYKGYLGKITDFRNCDKIIGLGIYQIRNIKFNGSVIERMNCLFEDNAYPSPELEFYLGLGITFDIVRGCWGSSFDLNFEKHPRMFEKEGGVSHYCKWYGCLMKLNFSERYNFNCKELNFAKLNNYHTDNDIKYSYDEKYGILEYKKKKVYHSFHVASFMASYSRISVLEQILKFKDFNQIVSVVVDGIYYKGDVEIGELFCSKQKKSLKNNLTEENYCQYDEIENIDIGDYRENNKLEVHLGAGGCGKTHKNLTDKGLMQPIYIAPSWKLARDKKSEYDIDSSVFHYLLEDDPSKWQRIYQNYSVLIIDEISMLCNEDKKKIIERFYEHKIIFNGDIGYQLKPIEGEEFKIENEKVFNHTINYRCKCEKLQKALDYLRLGLSKGLNKVTIKGVIKRMNIEIVNKDEIDYSVEDLIICKTNKRKDIYTERYKNLEKYCVLENCRDWSNGQIIIGPKPPGVRCVLQHGFTIYSVQGMTAKNKLFVDVNGIYTLRVLYTAMSRCRTIDQLVLME